MLTIYKSRERGLETMEEVGDGCWVHMVSPEPEELARLQELGIPPEFLTHVRDLDERPRIERDGNVVLIVLHFPSAQGATADIPFITLPLTIVVTDSLIVTIVPQPTGFLQGFMNGYVRGLSTTKRTRFVLQMLWYLAKEYLARLREINVAVEKLEDQLHVSLRNREVMGLLKYEKSLVYFTTALRSNETVLQRLQKGSLVQRYPDDEELLEDVLIEVRQAIEMVHISQDILSQMMDAYASIVSNNLNVVMKFLTSATIVISLPTLIASIYGMNVPLPGAGHPLSFLVILSVSVLVALVVIIVFWRKNWF
jgi:magnesium transporter